MKWFKHISSSWDDEKLSKVIDEVGLEGYGFWWRLLEIIAEKMDETGNTSLEFSAKKWSTFFGISAKKFKNFVEIFKNFEIFSVFYDEKNPEIIKIDIPNLAKYQDNYSKNLQAANKKKASDLQAKIKIKNKNNINSLSTKENAASAESEPEIFPSQEEKTPEPIPEPKPERKIPDEYAAYAQEFQQSALQAQPGIAPKVTDVLIRQGAQEIDKAIRLDGLDFAEIKAALEWARQDSFWSPNVLSLAQIRRKGGNGISKLQTIIGQYRKAKQQRASPAPSRDSPRYESRYEREQREMRESYQETMRILGMMDGNKNKQQGNTDEQGRTDFIDVDAV